MKEMIPDAKNNQKRSGGTICIERHLSGWIREKAINRSLQKPLFERGECSIFLQGCIATWKMTRILQEYLHHGNHASSNVISLPPFSIIQTIDWWIDATSFPQLQLPSISYSIREPSTRDFYGWLNPRDSLRQRRKSTEGWGRKKAAKLASSCWKWPQNQVSLDPKSQSAIHLVMLRTSLLE